MEEQMDMLGLRETIDLLATGNGVRWYGRVNYRLISNSKMESGCMDM